MDLAATRSPSSIANARALPRAFYLQPTLVVARHLLGKLLCHQTTAGISTGRIVEVEAYRGITDRAAHTFGGRHTARNESMWGPPGHAYVYFVYGMHHCVNVVTRPAGIPEAVLIRALEPIDGVSLMRQRRGRATEAVWSLCRGPGSLCRALGITRGEDGDDLTTGPLRILDAPGIPGRSIVRTPRIGVDYAGTDAQRPWRFSLRDCRAVSGPRGVR